MSIRNLDAIFRPKSIALIGASPQPHSIGRVIADNLRSGGFAGPIMPVNPRHKAIAGVPVYPDVASLPLAPDLAVICTPPGTVPGLIAELGRRGTKGAVVITAGFKELGSAEGRALEQSILDAARPHLMRIVGPNCVGVLSTPVGINASFSHMAPKRGNVAFVTQSGAMVTTILDWASTRGIGFSHLVSLGDMADVDFGDMLDYLASDPETEAILLYIEAITHARKFMSAARAASRLKPVIAIKAGRHAAAARAAASHTGAMAGADGVYDAAFRRAGMLRVHTLEELFDAVETLAKPLKISGERLAILTNGGGAGVLATDALLDLGGKLPDLSPETVRSLDRVLPSTWSRGNPVDIVGDAGAERYAGALGILLDSPDVDAVLAINCPTAVASSTDAARAVIDTVAAKQRPIVLTNWLGSVAPVEARRLFAAARIPTYETPDEAVRGFMHLVRHRRNQEMLKEVPPSAAPGIIVDVSRARQIVRRATEAGRHWLDAAEIQDLFNCYRIPIVRTETVATPDEAGRVASRIGGKIALKILSPDITHKSDVGGVALDLEGDDGVRIAASAMRDRVTKAAPKARLSGFTVQQMVHRKSAHELILGMSVDRQFGPFLLFGQGGTGVEVIADRALALPPLNQALALDLMSGTRIFRQLEGYRDRPAANLPEIASILVRLSTLITDLDEIVELDINPLLVDAEGAIALDARIRVEAPAIVSRPGSRLAISPYPKEWECEETVAGHGRLRLRPVRPEDASAFIRLFEKMQPEDIRRRFFSPVRSLSLGQLARFTQIDYDREMAFVLEDLPSQGDIMAVARLAADPDNRRAEFAVTVRSDLKGRGIGNLMMRRLIEYARKRGIGELFGDILSENAAMLALAKDLGFTLRPRPETANIMTATLVLAV